MRQARRFIFWTAVLAPVLLSGDAAADPAPASTDKAAEGARAEWHFSTAAEEASPASGTFSVMSDSAAGADAGILDSGPETIGDGASLPAVELLEGTAYDAYGNKVVRAARPKEVGSSAVSAEEKESSPPPAQADSASEETGGAKGTAEPSSCGGIEARLEHRREWLRARRAEQFALGGAPNAEIGIRDATQQWCEDHPDDAECRSPAETVFFSTEELQGGQAPEEYDRGVILMKRALSECRRQSSGIRGSGR